MTLEELDANKKGTSEVARNAARRAGYGRDRQRESPGHPRRHRAARTVARTRHRQIFLQTEAINIALPAALPTAKGDNQILAVVMHLAERFPERPVILVSKDINMRIKARALGLDAQDYFNDKVLEDTDLLYSGSRELPPDFWDTHGKGMESWKEEGHTYYRVKGPLASNLLVNEFLYQDGESSLRAWVKERDGASVLIETLTDYAHTRNNVWGITARNREQNFALNLLLNPEIDFVTLLGQAGTGKTLLTLAAALTQVLEAKRYSEIIMTRVTVPVGEDIGFLPGTEEEKMAPWMGALEDNLDV